MGQDVFDAPAARRARYVATGSQRPMRVPLLPELDLELADENVRLFEATGGYRSDTPPPFWSFAWPGGVALARHLLDHPGLVAGRSVMDLGAGSGIAGIAAARA